MNRAEQASLAEGAVMVRPGAPDWNAMAAAAKGAPIPPGAKISITPLEVVGWKAYREVASATPPPSGWPSD